MLGTVGLVEMRLSSLRKMTPMTPMMDVFDAPAPTRRLQQEDRQPWQASRNEASGTGRGLVPATAFVGLHLDDWPGYGRSPYASDEIGLMQQHPQDPEPTLQGGEGLYAAPRRVAPTLRGRPPTPPVSVRALHSPVRSHGSGRH